ncbi:anti-repressor SinI family protein [Aureibacillus halotolerans]|nr:anti-repressor SinI family protein [Aureibacillus halotolerans]
MANHRKTARPKQPLGNKKVDKEWVLLMIEARGAGISKEEIARFLKQK